MVSNRLYYRHGRRVRPSDPLEPWACASARRAGTIPRAKGTWNGLFYPATRSKRAGTDDFDELRFYAEHFDTVEVNSTFYGQPRAEVTRGWAERTPPGFEFSLKLYQKFTHPEDVPRGGAEARARRRGAAARSARAGHAERHRRVPRRHRSAGRRRASLGALLAQFPPSFKDAPAIARLPRAAAAGVRRLPDRRRTAARAGATPSATRWRC